jgi:hypothetical protein
MGVSGAPKHRSANINAREREFQWLANAVDDEDGSLKTASRFLLELQECDRSGGNAGGRITKRDRQ